MSLDSVGGGAGSNTNTGSRMKHSLSTPSGVDGSTTPHQRGSSAGINVNGSGGGGKKLAVRVQMLDDTITMFQVQVSDVISLQAVVGVGADLRPGEINLLFLGGGLPDGCRRSQ